MPNLKWSFSDSHMRLEEGGWARQTTVRELPISKAMAGVNMRLKAGVVREMHWHKEAEWAYMIKGKARITAVDQDGRTFADDVGEGDLWYFPGGIPHSIQGLAADGVDGCEFLLVFDDGGFSEDSTFLLTDWLAHTRGTSWPRTSACPRARWARSPRRSSTSSPGRRPARSRPTRWAAPATSRRPSATGCWRRSRSAPGAGRVRITDSTVFPASVTIAAALVEVEPGGLRELHWHPNSDEWQYYLSGKGRMTVFGSESKARTFDYQAGDVGYVPYAMGHYIENTATRR